MGRHKELSVRLVVNIKRLRANITEGILRDYIAKLQITLDRIPSTHIYNFDESNLSDDPGRLKVVVKQDTKYPELVCISSKVAYSIMLCGLTAGELLPMYVVYKAECLWTTWEENGPPGCKYD